MVAGLKPAGLPRQLISEIGKRAAVRAMLCAQMRFEKPTMSFALVP